jgi:hypothetical protein
VAKAWCRRQHKKQRPSGVARPRAVYATAARGVYFIAAGMHIIIGMPPHIIIIGMPADIMLIIRWQYSLNMSIDMPSMGMTLHIIASLVISQVMRIIGIGMGIGIMPLIIGIIPPIIGIMPPIIGIMGIVGIMPPGMVPIGICMAGIIGFGSFIARSRRMSARAGGPKLSMRRVLAMRSRSRQDGRPRALHFAPMK